MLTVERLKEVLDYNPLTGVLTWKVATSKRVKVGATAGSLNYKGYIVLAIDGKNYMSHRVIWFGMTGNWPTDQIDHDNTIKTDNRWINLRESDNSGNQTNQPIDRTNTSGFKGVSWNKQHGYWHAYISKNKKRANLGYFGTAEEASQAYIIAADKLHKEFARC